MEGLMTQMLQQLQRIEEQRGNKEKKLRETSHFTVEQFLETHLVKDEDSNVYKKLKILRQVGPIDDYLREFEALMVQITNPCDDQLLGYFMAGLKLQVRCRVRSFRPTQVVHAMEIARIVDEEIRFAEEQSLAPKASIPLRSNTDEGIMASILVDDDDAPKEEIKHNKDLGEMTLVARLIQIIGLKMSSLPSLLHSNVEALSKRPPPMPPDLETCAVADFSIYPACRLHWDPGGAGFVYIEAGQD